LQVIDELNWFKCSIQTALPIVSRLHLLHLNADRNCEKLLQFLSRSQDIGNHLDVWMFELRNMRTPQSHIIIASGLIIGCTTPWRPEYPQQPDSFMKSSTFSSQKIRSCSRGSTFFVAMMILALFNVRKCWSYPAEGALLTTEFLADEDGAMAHSLMSQTSSCKVWLWLFPNQSIRSRNWWRRRTSQCTQELTRHLMNVHWWWDDFAVQLVITEGLQNLDFHFIEECEWNELDSLVECLCKMINSDWHAIR
jgi:hypothetical protein